MTRKKTKFDRPIITHRVQHKKWPITLTDKKDAKGCGQLLRESERVLQKTKMLKILIKQTKQHQS